MRFIDANVFGHAFLKSRRKITPDEAEIKESAKAIIRNLEAGEEMTTSTVHVSEVLNILEDHLGVEQSTAFLAWVIASKNLSVLTVGLDDYESAINTARVKKIGLNDALAYHFMNQRDISEVYSMDRHFDGLEGVKRLTRA